VLGLIAIDLGRLAMEEARARSAIVTPPS
jgi:hypothetical protein